MNVFGCQNECLFLSDSYVCVVVCRVELGDWDWLIIQRLTSGIVRAAAGTDYTHTNTHTQRSHTVTFPHVVLFHSEDAKIFIILTRAK